MARAGLRHAAVEACTDLERWLDENPLEVRPSVAPNPSASLPPVDWLSRLSLITTPPAIVVEDPEPIRESALARTDEIAWALALAAQHVASECARGVRFAALRRAAEALLAIEPTARRALASTSLERLATDRGSRAVREGLLAIAFAEYLTDAGPALRTIAVAAMAQSFLDTQRREDAIELLCAEVARDRACIAEVVTAYEALCIRRECALDDVPLHARLVALACEDARLSLIEGRASSLSIEVDLADLEVVDDLDRPSVELPPTTCANGTSTLAKIPLAHFVATAHERELSATIVLTDPRGSRHAVVFRGGNLDAVHTRAAPEIVARLAVIAALPEETEIAFFWEKDLLAGRGVRAPKPAAEVLLAIARASDRARMRAEIENVGRAFVVHAKIDALRATDDERRLMERWNAASRGGRALDARILTGEVGLPVAYTLMHLGEMHPVGHRCRTCKRALR